jgi:hypothetical protein
MTEEEIYFDLDIATKLLRGKITEKEAYELQAKRGFYKPSQKAQELMERFKKNPEAYYRHRGHRYPY